VALPCAFLLKRFQGAPVESSHRQKDLAFSGTVYEIALVVMSAYMAYLTAEVSIIYSLLLSNDQDQHIEGIPISCQASVRTRGYS